MEFEWDDAKEAANSAKHGFTFTVAQEAFNDPAHLIFDVTRPEHGENRWKIVGQVGPGVIVAVIYTNRGDQTRIISARRSRRNERVEYYASQNAG